MVLLKDSFERENVLSEVGSIPDERRVFMSLFSGCLVSCLPCSTEDFLLSNLAAGLVKSID